MKQEKFPGATSILVAVMTTAFLVLFSIQSAMAQKTKTEKTDEQVLRELIQKENEGARAKLTEDTILYNATVPRPVIGREAVTARAQEVSSRRINEKRERQIRRLVVAKSGDLAYEFGDTKISFDTPDKTHVSFISSYLRVWRKAGGEWMVDAHFARPHDAEEEKKQN